MSFIIKFIVSLVMGWFLGEVCFHIAPGLMMATIFNYRLIVIVFFLGFAGSMHLLGKHK